MGPTAAWKAVPDSKICSATIPKPAREIGIVETGAGQIRSRVGLIHVRKRTAFHPSVIATNQQPEFTTLKVRLRFPACGADA
jgi:hypothetical protein